MSGCSRVGSGANSAELTDGTAPEYSEDYIQTLGVNFMEKTISIRNTEITFSVGAGCRARACLDKG